MNSWYNLFDDISHPAGLSERYDVGPIPALILIDKKGTILGRYGGDGIDGDETVLYAALDKIFGAEWVGTAV